MTLYKVKLSVTFEHQDTSPLNPEHEIVDAVEFGLDDVGIEATVIVDDVDLA